MDILVISAYPSGMFARLVAMLAMLAIVVMTTVTFAHAARLSVGPDHAVHVGEMMQATDGIEHSCDHVQPYGPTDSGACEFFCAGLSVFPPSPGGEAVRGYGLASHGMPPGAIHASRAPGLNERPPKLPFL